MYCEIRGHLETIDSLPNHLGPGDGTEVISLGPQYLYSLSHLLCVHTHTHHHPLFFFEVGFHVVQADLGLAMYRQTYNGGRH